MAQTALNMVDQGTELSCVVIPAGKRRLLLPNVCVAEIVPWRRIKEVRDTPDWCLGITGWRGITIPVLNYAAFTGEAATATPRCLVVMNRARSREGQPFYAMAAEALPYMVQLSDEDLRGDNSNLGEADVMAVKMGAETAFIPDLEYIETQVRMLTGGSRTPE